MSIDIAILLILMAVIAGCALGAYLTNAYDLYCRRNPRPPKDTRSPLVREAEAARATRWEGLYSYYLALGFTREEARDRTTRKMHEDALAAEQVGQ